MDPRDMFRGLFGFGGRRFDGNERPADRLFDEDGGEEFGEAGEGMEDMFQHFHEEMQQQMDQLHRQMEDMFKHFGSADFSLVIPGSPSLPASPENPRDNMLKKPDSDDDPAPVTPGHPAHRGMPFNFGGIFSNSIPRWDRLQPHEKVDKDLDSNIDGKDIGRLLDKPAAPDVVQPAPGFRPFSQHRSVSITTVRGADGKIEQRKTVRDSEGNEETTVTRQMGDKSHRVWKKKDELGVVEEKESFENLNKDELPSFDNHWQNQGRQPSDPRLAMIVPRSRRDMDTGMHEDKDLSIFKKLFGFDIWGRKS